MPAAKYTTPSATTGPPRAGHRDTIRSLPRTISGPGPPRFVHSVFPSAAARQCRKPSSLATNTRPSATAGANRTGPPVNAAHRSTPVAASRAYTLPSAELPTYTASPAATGWSARSNGMRDETGQAGVGGCARRPTQRLSNPAGTGCGEACVRAGLPPNVGQSSARAAGVRRRSTTAARRAGFIIAFSSGTRSDRSARRGDCAKARRPRSEHGDGRHGGAGHGRLRNPAKGDFGVGPDSPARGRGAHALPAPPARR